MSRTDDHIYRVATPGELEVNRGKDEFTLRFTTESGARLAVLMPRQMLEDTVPNLLRVVRHETKIHDSDQPLGEGESPRKDPNST